MEKRTENQTQTKWTFITLQIVIVILAVAIGVFGQRFVLSRRGDLGLLRQARDILIENTILELPEDPELQYSMIRGMLDTLDDPNTFFVEPAQHEVQTDQLTGSYGGIGVRLEQDTDMNWRLYPLPDSPARQAGIQDGDHLLRVEDQEVSPEMEGVNLIASMRGPVGEALTITIAREDETLTFTIERQSVPIPSVTQHLLPEAPQIGLVVVNRIAGTTADEIQDGIEALLSQDAAALILDLRDNGGGLVETGVEIAQLFLTDGEIIRQQFKDQKVDIFEVDEPGQFTDMPMVVLVNGNTASSAEIVAGALQVQDRAILIGAPTFAKTTIQYIFDLDDGSSIHVTSGRWWIPGQTFPLTPDIEISADTPAPETIQAAIAYLSEFLK